MIRLFGKDFNDYRVVETKKINICGDKISSSFHIEFARYIFGFKFYINFYERDYYDNVTVKSNTKEGIINKYKNFIRALSVSKEKIYHKSEKICQ